jgi:predicted DNA binding CopG/RHH family protein
VGTKLNKEEEIKIRLESSLKKKYKSHCKKHKLDMSKHIREFIEKEINVKSD